MSSASIYVKPTPYTDGTVGIFVRIIHERKIHLRQIARHPAGQVDPKTGKVRGRTAEAHKLNQLINNELAAARDYLLECNLKGVEPDPAGYFQRSQHSNLIADHVIARADEMDRAGKHRNADKHRSTAVRIIKLGLNVPVEEITESWVKKFDAGNERMGNNPNTRHKHLAIVSATLRSIEGAPDPFRRFRKPSNRPNRAKLSPDDIARLAAVKLTGLPAAARNMFLFAVYARDMRVHDLMTLQWCSVRDGRIRYVAAKTGKVQDIRITPSMQGILDNCDRSGVYVFPFLKMLPEHAAANPRRWLERINRTSWRVNRWLAQAVEAAGIDKHVTMHVARHTFAFLADQSGISVGTIQQLLDHGKITTTAGYVESLRQSDELDRAVDGMFTEDR